MKSFPIALVGAGVAVGVLFGSMVQPVVSSDTVTDQTRKFGEVLNTVVQNYVEDVEANELVEAALKSMLEKLDPHSVYIPPVQKKKVDEDFSGSFEGIGISFSIVKDTITVETPIVGGPSEKLGILAGDKIVKIDGQNAVGLDQEEVPKKLKGPKGTVVTVTVKRGNDEGLDFSIVRDKIPIYSVDAHFIIQGTDVGYIRMNRFAQNTYDEMMKAATELKSMGMKKLILDLRSNPGGFLNQAFAIADEFIPGNSKLVYTEGRRPEFNRDYNAYRRGILEELPLIVLINASSASASEIVSGAVQDLDRGLVVGETSFGKGLVQQQYTLADGSAYRVTTSKYFTPSGRCIQRDYKDKKKYYSLEGRAELEEGENIQHTADTADTARPAYKTRSGRVVYGGGGIVPDYVVKSDTVSKFYIDVIRSGAFREAMDTYFTANGADLRTKYSDSFASYLSSYSVPESFWKQLRTVFEAKKYEWDKSKFDQDKSQLTTAVKIQVARLIWNINESVQVSMESDKQVQKALTLFPEASRVAQLGSK